MSRKKWSSWNFGSWDRNSMENWSPGQFFHSMSIENRSASGKMGQSIKYCSLLAVMTVQVVESSSVLQLIFSVWIFVDHTDNRKTIFQEWTVFPRLDRFSMEIWSTQTIFPCKIVPTDQISMENWFSVQNFQDHFFGDSRTTPVHAH